MSREQILLRRIKRLTWFFIVGLVISGATAIPLDWELNLLVNWLGLAGQASTTATSELGRWLFDFGLISCVLVIPFALLFGALRGIPFWRRLIDCSFGGFGAIPLWFCRKWSLELERHLSGR